MQIRNYLFFNGRCEEAITFYRKAIGAQQTVLMRFSESPVPPQPGMTPPGSENKVMHAAFKVGDTEILASDGDCRGQCGAGACSGCSHRYARGLSRRVNVPLSVASLDAFSRSKCPMPL